MPREKLRRLVCVIIMYNIFILFNFQLYIKFVILQSTSNSDYKALRKLNIIVELPSAVNDDQEPSSTKIEFSSLSPVAEESRGKSVEEEQEVTSGEGNDDGGRLDINLEEEQVNNYSLESFEDADGYSFSTVITTPKTRRNDKPLSRDSLDSSRSSAAGADAESAGNDISNDSHCHHREKVIVDDGNNEAEFKSEDGQHDKSSHLLVYTRTCCCCAKIRCIKEKL